MNPHHPPESSDPRKRRMEDYYQQQQQQQQQEQQQQEDSGKVDFSFSGIKKWLKQGVEDDPYEYTPIPVVDVVYNPKETDDDFMSSLSSPRSDKEEIALTSGDEFLSCGSDVDEERFLSAEEDSASQGSKESFTGAKKRKRTIPSQSTTPQGYKPSNQDSTLTGAKLNTSDNSSNSSFQSLDNSWYDGGNQTVIHNLPGMKQSPIKQREIPSGSPLKSRESVSDIRSEGLFHTSKSSFGATAEPPKLQGIWRETPHDTGVSGALKGAFNVATFPGSTATNQGNLLPRKSESFLESSGVTSAVKSVFNTATGVWQASSSSNSPGIGGALKGVVNVGAAPAAPYTSRFDSSPGIAAPGIGHALKGIATIGAAAGIPHDQKEKSPSIIQKPSERSTVISNPSVITFPKDRSQETVAHAKPVGSAARMDYSSWQTSSFSQRKESSQSSKIEIGRSVHSAQDVQFQISSPEYVDRTAYSLGKFQKSVVYTMPPETTGKITMSSILPKSEVAETKAQSFKPSESPISITKERIDIRSSSETSTNVKVSNYSSSSTLSIPRPEMIQAAFSSLQSAPSLSANNAPVPKRPDNKTYQPFSQTSPALLGRTGETTSSTTAATKRPDNETNVPFSHLSAALLGKTGTEETTRFKKSTLSSEKVSSSYSSVQSSFMGLTSTPLQKQIDERSTFPQSYLAPKSEESRFAATSIQSIPATKTSIDPIHVVSSSPKGYSYQSHVGYQMSTSKVATQSASIAATISAPMSKQSYAAPSFSSIDLTQDLTSASTPFQSLFGQTSFSSVDSVKTVSETKPAPTGSFSFGGNVEKTKGLPGSRDSPVPIPVATVAPVMSSNKVAAAPTIVSKESKFTEQKASVSVSTFTSVTQRVMQSTIHSIDTTPVLRAIIPEPSVAVSTSKPTVLETVSLSSSSKAIISEEVPVSSETKTIIPSKLPNVTSSPAMASTSDSKTSNTVSQSVITESLKVGTAHTHSEQVSKTSDMQTNTNIFQKMSYSSAVSKPKPSSLQPIVPEVVHVKANPEVVQYGKASHTASSDVVKQSIQEKIDVSGKTLEKQEATSAKQLVAKGATDCSIIQESDIGFVDEENLAMELDDSTVADDVDDYVEEENEKRVKQAKARRNRKKKRMDSTPIIFSARKRKRDCVLLHEIFMQNLDFIMSPPPITPAKKDKANDKAEIAFTAVRSRSQKTDIVTTPAKPRGRPRSATSSKSQSSSRMSSPIKQKSSKSQSSSRMSSPTKQKSSKSLSRSRMSSPTKQKSPVKKVRKATKSPEKKIKKTRQAKNKVSKGPTFLDEKVRLKVGKYASENGTAAAIKKFSPIYGRLPPSSVQGYRSQYWNHLATVKEKTLKQGLKKNKETKQFTPAKTIKKTKERKKPVLKRATRIKKTPKKKPVGKSRPSKGSKKVTKSKQVKKGSATAKRKAKLTIVKKEDMSGEDALFGVASRLKVGKNKMKLKRTGVVKNKTVVKKTKKVTTKSRRKDKEHKYKKYTGKERYIVGKYAHEHGIAASAKKFQSNGILTCESTLSVVRVFMNRYREELALAKKEKREPRKFIENKKKSKSSKTEKAPKPTASAAKIAAAKKLARAKKVKASKKSEVPKKRTPAKKVITTKKKSVPPKNTKSKKREVKTVKSPGRKRASLKTQKTKKARKSNQTITKIKKEVTQAKNYQPKYSWLSKYKNFYLVDTTKRTTVSNKKGKDSESPSTSSKPVKGRFSHAQVCELERIFSTQKYISTEESKVIAKAINITSKQAMQWFNTRRKKWRSVMSELEDEVKVQLSQT